MKRLLFALALLASMAQESTFGPHDYCRYGPPEKDNPRAHECACKLICSLDEESGEHVRRETQECKAYCKPKQCVCHSDEPCGQHS